MLVSPSRVQEPYSLVREIYKLYYKVGIVYRIRPVIAYRNTCYSRSFVFYLRGTCKRNIYVMLATKYSYLIYQRNLYQLFKFMF